ncbi:MAG: hypothetical protein ABSD73_02200 [Candidatus Bathyarchaeia archaeon]|jgi:hypothetical protein
MTLPKKLREILCKKLQIKERQLHNLVANKRIEEGITDPDVALLLIAHENKINVAKPMFSVPRQKIVELNQHLETQKIPTQVKVPTTRKGSQKRPQSSTRRLLRFKGKYPQTFYNTLEDEINTAYSNPKLPNATYMLTRKLIENLLYNLLEYKFGVQNISLYYDISNRRAHDFGVLLKNLKEHKPDFDPDQHVLIEKFLNIVHPFRRDVNSKAHQVIEYLDDMRYVRKAKIEDMTQILLIMIDRVKTNRPH